MDFPQTVPIPSFEIVVCVYVLALGASDFVEIVHVQLSHEGRKVLVLKVKWQNNLGKWWNVGDVKPILGRKPMNVWLTCRILHKILFTSNKLHSFEMKVFLLQFFLLADIFLL